MRYGILVSFFAMALTACSAQVPTEKSSSGSAALEGDFCYNNSDCDSGEHCALYCPPGPPGTMHCMIAGGQCKKNTPPPPPADTTCMADADCATGKICQPYCPVVPGQVHCEIAGGKCVSQFCNTDADCGADRVCNLYCPPGPPGTMHCMIAGGTCGQCAWQAGSESSDTISAHTWQSADTLTTYTFNADGSFTGVDQPACTIAKPIHCNIKVEPQTGWYDLSDPSNVVLYYDNGNVSTLAVQSNCKKSERLTGSDFNKTVTVSPIN